MVDWMGIPIGVLVHITFYLWFKMEVMVYPSSYIFEELIVYVCINHLSTFCQIWENTCCRCIGYLICIATIHHTSSSIYKIGSNERSTRVLTWLKNWLSTSKKFVLIIRKYQIPYFLFMYWQYLASYCCPYLVVQLSLYSITWTGNKVWKPKVRSYGVCCNHT